MAFDLATVKQRFSIADTTQDAALLATMNATWAAVENYLGRGVRYREVTVNYSHHRAGTIQLPTFPVDNIVDKKGIYGTDHINYQSGIIKLHSESFYRHEIQIHYFGGYQTIPDDLSIALLAIFDQFWGAMSSAGSASTGGGAIKSISSAGTSITYDTGGSGAVAGTDPATGWPSMAMALLRPYVLEKA